MARVSHLRAARRAPELANPGEPGTTGAEPGTAASESQDGTGRFTGGRYRVARRMRISSPVLQGLLALAVYLAAWLPTGAYELTAHLTTQLLDTRSMDPSFYIWTLRWWPYAIAHMISPLRTTLIGLPSGFNLAWVTTVPPISLLASPLTETIGPTASFNLLVVIAMPVTAWAAFVFCRRLTRQFWPSLVGGAVFGFSAYEVSHTSAGQLDLTFGLLVPLIGYLVLLWRDGSIRHWVFVLLAGLAMAVQFYLFMETFADLTAIIVIALVVGYVLAGRDQRRDVVRLAGLLGMAYAIALVLAAPYLDVALAHVPKNYVHVSGIDVASLVIPRPHTTFGVHWHWLLHDALRLWPGSLQGYVGIPLLVLAVLVAVLNWSSKITRFLLAMLVIIIVLALGPVVYFEGKPQYEVAWSAIWSWPILRSAFPARLIMFGFLVLAAMTAIFLAGPARKRWRLWARWSLGLLVVVALVANIGPIASRPARGLPRDVLPSFISSGDYKHYLSPGETVAVVSEVGNAGLAWQADTNFYFRLTGGYINVLITGGDLPYPIESLSSMTRHNARMRLYRFEELIVKARIRAILVQLRAEPRWADIFHSIGLHGSVADGVLIYPTDSCRNCHVPIGLR
jgi:hypothetical protein